MTFTPTLSIAWSEMPLALLWLVCMALALFAVFQLVGVRLMVCYFPEGRRWWMVPSQWAALAALATLSHYTPF